MPSLAVTVEETTYDGQIAYRVSNEAARIVVSPHLGRVVEFGATNGPNVIWQAPKGEFEAKGYRNVGGDKVWYSPQTTWNWPPDPAWDGSGLRATKLADGVRLEGTKGKILPLRLTREIHLDPYAAKVTFTNAMANDGPKPLNVGLWQVTQIAAPTEIRLSTFPTAAQPKGYAVLVGGFDRSVATVAPNELRIRLHPTQAYKYGAKGGDGTLTADVGKFRFTTFSKFSRAGRYADQDSAKQVYTASAATGYAELEHLAPLERLEPRQVQIQNVTWRLAPLSN
ncbi:hypothetical protein EON79_21205 [bacterium]|nr:MAG: hypothetical protein EON79_21205 [bacterium]